MVSPALICERREHINPVSPFFFFLDQPLTHHPSSSYLPSQRPQAATECELLISDLLV